MALMSGKQIGRWFADNGDETRALEWEGIDSHSTVWEIGGYEGRWTAQIWGKYQPFMHVFEPQGWAFEKLQDKFGVQKKIKLHNFGLWVMDASLPLYAYETDGASLLGNGARSQVCKFEEISRQVAGAEVDLCLMNVEGAEFVLIPYLIGMGLMNRFRYFWCQFHTFVQDADWRANAIYKGMLKTHKKIWDYYPTAVAWERNDSAPHRHMINSEEV